jgi:hypothetical protein
MPRRPNGNYSTWQNRAESEIRELKRLYDGKEKEHEGAMGFLSNIGIPYEIKHCTQYISTQRSGTGNHNDGKDIRYLPHL